MKQYDYIIAGAGCAGLSLLMRMIESGRFSDKKILLVDKAPKQKNDRTWCFWEKDAGFFEQVVFKQWDQISFHGNDFSQQYTILPYRYKMIRGIDFYRHCFSVIQQQSNITIEYGIVTKMESVANGAVMWLNDEESKAKYIFNSIPEQTPAVKKTAYYLLQHFKGWIIETPHPVFDTATATLMDFRVEQHKGTTFAYVMPLSATKALVEYTLFSKNLLLPAAYDEGLKNYLHQFLSIKEYKIEEEEFGVIPMTSHSFSSGQGNIINIGTAGGQTKASSGYTFQFIQKRTEAIVTALLASGNPFTQDGLTPGRFRFYDNVLLHILVNKTLGGDIIFSRLFRKNDPQLIFKFLDNETSKREDLSIIKSLPAFPFLRAAIAQLRG